MQKLEVYGANRLKGQINISGSKNASLPILAATLLSKNQITLKNLPKVKDIDTMLSLLKSIGLKILKKPYLNVLSFFVTVENLYLLKLVYFIYFNLNW